MERLASIMAALTIKKAMPFMLLNIDGIPRVNRARIFEAILIAAIITVGTSYVLLQRLDERFKSFQDSNTAAHNDIKGEVNHLRDIVEDQMMGRHK